MNKLLLDIEHYYTKKIDLYGATPKGVDWNSEESQNIRFNVLSQVILDDHDFSINDLGCGYGKYFEHLKLLGYKKFAYFGYDLSKKMINSAKECYKDKDSLELKKIESASEMSVSDYSIASGIFNVKMQYEESKWLTYILSTLDYMHNASKKGFAFNVLTKYSDNEYMKDNLYYADPGFLFDYCKRNYSNNVALLHDYELYEFTIIVRK